MRLEKALRRIFKDERGNVAIIFALALIPLLGLIGAAIDYSRATMERERIQQALDMTVLAVNRQIGNLNEDELVAYAQAMLEANLQGTEARIDRLDIDEVNRVVEMSATADIDTSIMQIMNFDSIAIWAGAQSVVGSSTGELALVLDNSGSMTGSRIQTLRQASRDLVHTLFGNDPVSEQFSISIVPFAGAVNVGDGQAGADWIDRNALSSAHQGIFVESVNRFDLYDEIKNVSWAGCVEARPEPYTATDVVPDIGLPDTLFVPTFAPDEPDPIKIGSWKIPYANSYLDDVSGGCPASVEDLGDVEKTGQVCKYDKVNAAKGSSGTTRSGPNYICDSEPITPLTSVKSDLLSAIGQMQAKGYTNIFEGVMWGWRTLSANAPFTEGRPAGTDANQKFMVVMTDGANTVPYNLGELGSAYTAFGHAALDRLGSNHENSALVERMNEYTLEACTNVRQAGIKIFTIAFDIDDADTVEMLRECASGADFAYTAQTTEQLSETFAEIAGQLGELRIAQ